MNYHIINQDKFFNQYIEDIYSIGIEDNNMFWVRGEKGENDYLKTQRPIEYLGWNHDEIINKFRSIKPNDKLIVNWYDITIANFILEANVQCPLYVNVMGGDLYTNPFECHAHWLFDKLTYRALVKAGIIHSYWYIPSNRTLKQHIATCLTLPFYKKKIWKQKEDTLARIDYISCPKTEFEFLKKLYPSLNAQLVTLGFCQNFDNAIKQPIKEPPGQKFNILVGNSCDPANNHRDAYVFLKKNLHEPYAIYSFLSYGKEVNLTELLSLGHSLFGDLYKPITNFMSLSDFVTFFNDIDIVIMYHNRQQAYSNILVSIAQGKPVFLKKENVIYQTLTQEGIVYGIYDINKIGQRSLFEIIQETHNHRQENIAILKKIYSDEVRRKNYKNILS